MYVSSSDRDLQCRQEGLAFVRNHILATSSDINPLLYILENLHYSLNSGHSVPFGRPEFEFNVLNYLGTERAGKIKGTAFGKHIIETQDRRRKSNAPS